MAYPSEGRIPEEAGRGRAIHPRARRPSPETRRESHREKIYSKTWTDYGLKDILLQGIKMGLLANGLAIPLQAVQHFGDFQQGALIFRRAGVEMFADLDIFLNYFADLPPKEITESNIT